MHRKMEKCNAFFEALSKELKDKYVVVGSCNKDASAYLVPTGTENQISYYGKPAKSFRVSDHWNWYSNLKRCRIKEEVQCWSIDVPKPRERDIEKPEMATMPRRACQVAYYSSADRKYHVVYGERFNRSTYKWEWLESDPVEIAKRYSA